MNFLSYSGSAPILILTETGLTSELKFSALSELAENFKLYINEIGFLLLGGEIVTLGLDRIPKLLSFVS